MKFLKYILAAQMLFYSTSVYAQEGEMSMNREQKTNLVYEELFASKRSASPTDPEFMEILQHFIFGEVFSVGQLDNKTRELITVVSLTTLQTLPQLKAHINAALNVGNSPLEVREAIYQCAPFIGFPRTLNAIGVFNEIMKERNIALPLDNAGTINEENRHAKGSEIQNKLYGDEIKKAMQNLPETYRNAVPDIVTDFCFGDFYTRGVLTLQQRELLSLTVLTALGAEKQLYAHIVGNLKAGNDKNTLLAAMVQAIPYIGLPNGLTAINLIKTADVENYQTIYK